MFSAHLLIIRTLRPRQHRSSVRHGVFRLFAQHGGLWARGAYRVKAEVKAVGVGAGPASSSSVTWSRAVFKLLSFDLQGFHSALELDVHGLFSLSPVRYCCMYGVSAVAVRGRVLVSSNVRTRE